MRLALLPVAALALAACPAAAWGPEAPLLIANRDGSVTITRAIESDPPRLLPLARGGRFAGNAGRARARAPADAAEERAFQEAVDQAREAARLPRPR
jgi:hypothetical protein